MTAGKFTLGAGGQEGNLEPKGEVPPDQEKISHGYYAIWNTLKLLKENRVFGECREVTGAAANPEFKEFLDRNLQAAKVGCVADEVNTRLAESAQGDIRDDIVRRKGRPLVYRYLRSLAKIAALGAIPGAALIMLAYNVKGLDGLKGYGEVLIGSMVGAWLSSASARQDISFDNIKDYVDRRDEPFVRILFVLLIAGALAMVLGLGLLTLKVGTVDFKEFSSNPPVAFVLGLICGISEKAVSVKLIDRTRKIISP